MVRLLQIYSVLLVSTALYFFDLKLFIISVILGWVLQGLSTGLLIHRKYSHNQFQYKNIVWELLGYVTLISTMQGSPINWAYGHRIHHRYTDAPNDPQSPHSIGKLKTFFSIFPSVVEGWDGIINDLIKDRRLIIFHRYYLCFAILYSIILFSIDPILACYLIGIPSMFAWLTLGIVNTASHTDKGHPKDLRFPLLFWGENYHGTHHKDPSLKRQGNYDMCWYVMKVIGK